VDDLVYRLAQALRETLRGHAQRLEAAFEHIRQRDPRHRLAELRQALQARTGTLTAAMHAALFQRGARLQQLITHLQALSPLQVLERGYALVFDSSGNLVKDAQQVSPGDDIRARLAHGEIRATVKEEQPLATKTPRKQRKDKNL
jgi:exodeoxyribonuclease VII large subunit